MLALHAKLAGFRQVGVGLWQGDGELPAPRRIAQDLGNANFGDSTEWYVRRDSTLWVKGLAHCGQQGDRRRIATADLVSTAGDAVAVRAHAGKTNHRRQDGVMSAGGKCYRQLGPHGLGDQADRWGRWFDRVRAIAIDLRHSAAIRTDSSLCAWEESFDIAPRRLREAIVAVAVGNTARIQAVLDDRIIFDETPHGASDPMQRTADAVQVALPQPDAADSLGHPGTTAPAGVRERQQGRFLAVNSEYVAANQAGVAPLYAELQGFFNLTPPSVNAVLVQFERCSFTPRVFGKARAIEVRGTAAQLPPLERTHMFRPQSGPRPLRAISGLQRHVPGHGGDAAQARCLGLWVRDLLAKGGSFMLLEASRLGLARPMLDPKPPRQLVPAIGLASNVGAGGAQCPSPGEVQGLARQGTAWPPGPDVGLRATNSHESMTGVGRVPPPSSTNPAPDSSQSG